jgi:hypothetical protein
MKTALGCAILALLPACAGAPDDESGDDGVDEWVQGAVVSGPISESPNTVSFPSAIFGDGACGSGGSSCTYAMATLTNTGSTSQKISGASATGAFWVTWGGTCNDTAHAKTIKAGQSCTLQFGFKPTAAKSKYAGTGTVTFSSGVSISFALAGKSVAGLTASPSPLVFPNATFGGTTCGSVGGTACTYALETITNNDSTTKTISTASASNAAGAFWVTWGGTCNARDIAPHSSCTLQFGFKPVTAATTYNGRASVSFATGESVSFTLGGTSN